MAHNTEAETLLRALGDDPHLDIAWEIPNAGEFTVRQETVDGALAVINHAGDDANLWYGINRAHKTGTRTREAAVTRWTALYADLDVGKPMTPGSIDAAYTIIEGLPEPTFIVHSGHGLQPIWLLTGDEFNLPTPERRAWAKVQLTRWGNIIAARAAAHGWTIDSVFDLARLMRVPGSVNRKKGLPDVRARLEIRQGAALDLADLTDMLAAEEKTHPATSITPSGHIAVPAADMGVIRQWLGRQATFSAPATPYGRKALDDLLAEQSSSRHAWLIRSATRVAELVATGQLDPHIAFDELRTEFDSRIGGERPTGREFLSAVAWGVAQAGTTPPPTPVEPVEPSNVLSFPQPSTMQGEAKPAGNSRTEHPATQPSQHDLLVAQELVRLRAQTAARATLAAEEHAKSFREPPGEPDLTRELSLPDDDEETYIIDGLVPENGNILLTAQFKAGKTTLTANLARALADSDKFLGKWPTHMRRRVALWNYEVSRRQYRRWLRELSVTNPDRIVPLTLRGFRLPLIHPFAQDWAVAWLRRHDVEVWVLDPFARAFAGCGDENSNTDVGLFLDAIDQIKERAGVSVCVLPAHTGRMVEVGKERARGATRLDDWADVRWNLTVDEEDNRFFSAMGRDVEVDEEQVRYKPESRQLIFGGGDREWVKRRNDVEALAELVREKPGMNVTQLREAMGPGRNEKKDALRREALRQRLIREETRGPSTVYYPNDQGPFSAL